MDLWILTVLNVINPFLFFCFYFYHVPDMDTGCPFKAGFCYAPIILLSPFSLPGTIRHSRLILYFSCSRPGECI